ncbi:hypothetical protein [Gloeobacter violaceus]|uniref:hypothetical protein n=1 Tax=Gloeobacter violaceus TaxID=33072 RepID=UPI0002E6A325|nr:hypothetical protein [Gloeobacter violaceus]
MRELVEQAQRGQLEAEQRAEREHRLRLEAERRAEAMAERLRAMGIDPQPLSGRPAQGRRTGSDSSLTRLMI